MEITSVLDIFNVTSPGNNMNASIATLNNGSVEMEFLDPLESGSQLPSWPCNHTGPLVMMSKYPNPNDAEAARALDIYEIMK
ncbi:hypothetical protein SK128_010745, partial [Halocaridina rubra]